MKHEIFEANTQLKKVFATADGQVFYTENDAQNHAKNLEDKSVETVLNPDFLEVTAPENVSDAVDVLAESEEKEELEKEDVPQETPVKKLDTKKQK